VNISNAAGSVSTPQTSQAQTAQTQSNAKANDNVRNNMSSELSSALANNASAESVELDGGYLVLRVCIIVRLL
jgi:hypothetical protein